MRLHSGTSADPRLENLTADLHQQQTLNQQQTLHQQQTLKTLGESLSALPCVIVLSTVHTVQLTQHHDNSFFSLCACVHALSQSLQNLP